MIDFESQARKERLVNTVKKETEEHSRTGWESVAQGASNKV